MASIIEGRIPILEALRSGRPISKIFLARNIERHSVIAEIIHLAQIKNIPVEYVERPAIDRQSETGANQGIMAYTISKEYIELDELFKISRERKENALYLILDGVEDPHNLGAIIRTAEASGIHGVIVREKRAVGLTPTVEKASAGAIEYIPICRVTNIAQTIESLKKENIWVVGIDQAGPTDYTRIDFKVATAIVVGGEGKGLSDLVKKRCDFLASIPMKGKINSLNASVAAGVVMYEAVKQRTGE